MPLATTIVGLPRMLPCAMLRQKLPLVTFTPLFKLCRKCLASPRAAATAAMGHKRQMKANMPRAGAVQGQL